MLRFAFPIAAAASALAVAAHPLAAAEVRVEAQGPVIELNISESTEVAPDIAEIGAGVTTQAQTAVAAMQANAQAMNAVIARIEALGIAEEDIQTSGISLQPQYDYSREGNPPVLRGYQVSNRVSVTLREIERAGQVLDALVEAGATDLSGPNWSVEDSTAARDQARQRAMRTAQDRAMEYARLAGYSGVRLLQVSETVDSDRPVPMMRLQSADVREESTPERPGQVQAGVSISVTYEMMQ